VASWNIKGREMNKRAAKKSLKGDERRGVEKEKGTKSMVWECVHHLMEDRCLCS